jgi:hypothetical protein
MARRSSSGTIHRHRQERGRRNPAPALARDQHRRRVMARADDHSPLAHRDATADLSGVEVILECERAASRRNRRDRDPKRWSKTAWRRYFCTAARRPRRLAADLRTIDPISNARWPRVDGGLFYFGSDNNHFIGGSCPLECRDHRGTTTPWLRDRERTELNHRATTKSSRLSIQALEIVA